MKMAIRILTIFLFVGMLVPKSVRAEEVPAFKISGFVDAYYSYNFNNPDSRLNLPEDVGGSNFDFYHNTFSLNLAELVVSKAAEPVGFRMDLDFGPTTDFVHGGLAAIHPPIHGTSAEGEVFKNVQQAYVTWAAPFGVTFDLGKFVTHMGAEVIESKDNWNYTRGLLFCCAIPYYHAGLRANYPINDMIFVNGYVYNGWNNVIENNDMKTFGAQIGITPIPQLPILLNWVGPEECKDPATCTSLYTDRQVYDVIVTFNATDALSFMVNYDYGTQDGLGGAEDSEWSGVAVYAKYAWSETGAAVLRYETFDDEDGFGGFGTKIQEVTATYERKIGNGLLVRVEARQDMADDPIFEDEDGDITEDTQSRVVLGAIYSF